MKDAKVLQIRCHIGVQIGAQVVTSIDSLRDRAEMSLNPAGVLIRSHKGSREAQYIIPYSNLHSIKLEGEEPEAPVPALKKN